MTEAHIRGTTGVSVKTMPVLQDGAPPGGFPSVRFGRRIPNTGPTGTAIFGVSALVISYGFWKARAARAPHAALGFWLVRVRLPCAAPLTRRRRAARPAGRTRQPQAPVRGRGRSWRRSARLQPPCTPFADPFQRPAPPSPCSALRAEKTAARATLVPILQAEEDRAYVAARERALRAEAAAMAHVPGWRVGESPYNSGRWMPPALSTRPSVANS
jgi:hypothetical protein